MANYILRQAAIDDLSTIWEYTFYKWSETQADHYYTNLKLALIKLSQQPTLGKPYPEITPHLFGYRVGKHILFYQITSDQKIEVIRILHERMDFKRRL